MNILAMALILMFLTHGTIPASTNQDLNCDPRIDYFELAIQDVRKENYPLALIMLNCAVLQHPDDTAILYGRGQVHIELIQYREAVADFDRVIILTESKPNNVYVGAMFYKTGLLIYLGEDNLALNTLNKLIGLTDELSPEDYSGNEGLSSFYTVRAGIYADIDKPDLALADLEHAIELYSKNAAAYLRRGFIYQKSGDKERADVDIQHAMELDPTLVDSLRQTGAIFYIQQNYRKAFENFDYAMQLSLQPSAVDYMGRGSSYLGLMDYENAIQDLTRSLELYNNQDLTPLFYRGQAYLGVGQYDFAIQDLTRLIENHPLYYPTYFYRGEAYYHLNRIADAERDYCLYVTNVEQSDKNLDAAKERLEALHLQCSP